MFEMDKETFGRFLSQRRREQGLTQKQLAERLYVTDKAVSKWERGLSLPDVSLLLPLSQLLDVSVTELLEGRQLEAPMAPEEVETLVQKVLQYRETPPELRKAQQRQRLCIYLGTAAFSLVGAGILYASFGVGAWLTLELLSLIFGGFFWLGMPQRLPAYYDQERIAYFAHNGMHMHLPGVYYNNRNWPFVLRGLRVWSLGAMLLTPLAAGLLLALCPDGTLGWPIGGMVLLAVFLGSLLAALAVPARRHEFDGDQPPPARPEGKCSRRQFLFWLLAAALGLACLWLLGGGQTRSAVRVQCVEQASRRQWSARYQYLDGWMQRSLTLDSEAGGLLLQVESQQGNLSVQVTDREGRVLFDQQELASGRYPILASGRVQVRIQAEGHRGSFWIGPAGT